MNSGDEIEPLEQNSQYTTNDNFISEMKKHSDEQNKRASWERHTDWFDNGEKDQPSLQCSSLEQQHHDHLKKKKNLEQQHNDHSKMIKITEYPLGV